MKRFASFLTLATATITLATLQPSQTSVSMAQVLPQQATSDTADSRVKQALDSLGLNYEVEDSGAIKVGMRFDDQRTQVAYIASSTSALGDMEIREIVSPANLTDGMLSADMANQLLKDNSSKKLGAWQTVELKEGRHVTLFTAQIDANSSPEQLRSALYAVLNTADTMEEDLTGGDRF